MMNLPCRIHPSLKKREPTSFARRFSFLWFLPTENRIKGGIGRIPEESQAKLNDL